MAHINDQVLHQLEGMHTVETVAEALKMSTQSVLNLLSKLKKEGYVTVKGGGRRKRLYTITILKQRPRMPGMWDILNKYNPYFKLNPWFDYQVHGKYTVEDALVDAIETKSFRIILASLRLFNHITDWPKLYNLAKEKNSWQKVGALYDTARLFLRVRKMPEQYNHYTPKYWQMLTDLKKVNFPEISQHWKVYIPFNKNDIGGILHA